MDQPEIVASRSAADYKFENLEAVQESDYLHH